MNVLKKVLSVALPIMALALAGCGSGGSSDVTGTLSLTATAPDASGQHGVATAVYAPVNGKSPQGVVIDFSTNRPDIIALDSTSQTVGSDGTAPITFRAVTIANTTVVEIYATTGGLKATQQVTITGTSGGTPTTPVTPPPPVSATPNSISFNAAQPTNITLKGMGGAGLVETSIVSFIVKDTANQPLAGVTVDFSLNTTVGGLVITPTSGVSNASGIVQTIVSSGTIATPVKVTATIRGSNPLISVQSDQLVVSTGVPAQDGFSLSIETFNTESWNVDGVTSKVTARLSDHFHNPVPDGTAVSFTTSGGSIQPSCTTVGGVCSVTWTSQNPRPSNGVARILAYAVGEEAFTDLNGNGLADAGEFTDTSEAFRDDSGDGVRQTNETFIDFNGNGAFDLPDGKYNGVLQGAAYIGAPKSKHVFSNTTIVMSSSQPGTVSFDSTLLDPANETIRYLTVTDVNSNPLAKDSVIRVSGAKTSLLSPSYTVPNTAITGLNKTIFPVSFFAGGTSPGSSIVTVRVFNSPTAANPVATYSFVFTW